MATSHAPAAQPSGGGESPGQPPMTQAAYLRVVGLSAAVGLPAALVAALFLAFVHDLEHWLWTDLPDGLGYSSPPWYLVVGLPFVGACVVLAARRTLPGNGGHSPLDGLVGAPTPLAYAPGVALAAIGSLAFGAVLGPEAPLIALGSVVGLGLTHYLRLDQRESAIVASAGSFSAISALFGGPLVAGMLLVEAGVGMGAALIPILLPGLVAAAVGFVLFVGFGDWGGLDQPGLVVPGLPVYEGTHVLDLLLAIGVGVVAAVLIAAVRKLAVAVRDHGSQHVGTTLVLLGGGLAVGVLALVARGLGADSQDVLFSGQASVPDLVTETSTSVVLVLLASKAIAYAICLGCGFRGGPVFPAIFLGVALTMLTVIAFDVSPTFAVAVGTAAGTAAATRLLFAPVLFAALLVGGANLDVVPAAVLAAAATWLTNTALTRRAEAEAQP